MMARIGALSLAALMSASVVACERAGEKEQKAEGVANQQAQETQNEAFQKAANAQAQANQKIANARADFEKARDDYWRSRQNDLDGLNRTIADLENKQRTATTKAKVALDSRLPAIEQQRDQFANDLRSVPQVSAAAWDDTKIRLDNEWDALQKSVSAAK